MSDTVAIVALDQSEDQDHAYYLIEDVDDSGEEWQLFVERCNALLKTSPIGHIGLVRAAIAYGTADAKAGAEKKHYADCIASYMGNDFDPEHVLGTWRKLKDAAALNDKVIDDRTITTYVFVSTPHWADVDLSDVIAKVPQ